jgi:glycerophosphoryl diester phosphodiesterase
MPDLDWLTLRPIAHRGLHDAALRIVENTSSAVSAGIVHDYGIEVDLQITADGEAMVHHDPVLGRLTEGEGRLAEMTAAQLKRVRFHATADRMMCLGELSDLVAGRSLLLLELKSAFDGDPRLVQRTTRVLANYLGPVAVMSFDPAVVRALKDMAPKLIRGITAMGCYSDPAWAPLRYCQRRLWPYLLPAALTRPHFIAYALHDLPAAAPSLARGLFHLPVLTWVARSEIDRRAASRFADQIIFEGFTP